MREVRTGGKTEMTHTSASDLAPGLIQVPSAGNMCMKLAVLAAALLRTPWDPAGTECGV